MNDLPSQVQSAAALSDQLIAQMLSPPSQPETPAPAPAPAAASSTSAPAETPREQTVEYWMQRFNVVRGKLDAEVPALHRQLSERDARIAALEAQVAALKASTPAPPAPTPASPDLGSFDPELVDMTRQIARQVAQEAMQAFQPPASAPVSPNPPPTPAGPTPEQQAAQERFLDQLNDLVDDWRTIDAENAWRAYLAQIEPDTGNPRQVRLNAAVRAFDVLTTASIFNGYKRARNARQTPSLEAQLDPGRSLGASVPATNTGRIFTRSEIRKFYADCTNGTIKDPAEIARRDSEINAALRENRIAPG